MKMSFWSSIVLITGLVFMGTSYAELNDQLSAGTTVSTGNLKMKAILDEVRINGSKKNQEVQINPIGTTGFSYSLEKICPGQSYTANVIFANEGTLPVEIQEIKLAKIEERKPSQEDLTDKLKITGKVSIKSSSGKEMYSIEIEQSESLEAFIKELNDNLDGKKIDLGESLQLEEWKIEFPANEFRWNNGENQGIGKKFSFDIIIDFVQGV